MAVGWVLWWLSLAFLALWPSFAALFLWFSLALGTYWLVERRPPMLAAGDGVWRRFLCTKLPQIEAPLTPTPWLLESRIHTVVASLLPEVTQAPLTFRREVLPLLDGGQVALDWLDADKTAEDISTSSKKKVVALVIPGLNSDSSAAYMRASLKTAHHKGVTCVVFNKRGTGGIDLKTPRTFSVCSWEDVHEVACHVRCIHPDCTLIGLGFSIGGMMLSHLAVAQSSEELSEGKRSSLDAMIVVSILWDMRRANRSLDQGVNRFFSFVMARGMRHLLLRHRLLQSSPHFSLALKANSLREFEVAFIAKQAGFENVEHYHDSACLFDKVHQIRIPMLAISAADDPFMPGEGIPVEKARTNPHVAILVTPRGGHLGFLEGIFGQRQLFGDIWDSFLNAVIAEPQILSSFHHISAPSS